jgi:hypothetical protein
MGGLQGNQKMYRHLLEHGISEKKAGKVAREIPTPAEERNSGGD